MQQTLSLTGIFPKKGAPLSEHFHAIFSQENPHCFMFLGSMVASIEHCLLCFEDLFSFHPKYGVTLLPYRKRGLLTTSTSPGRCPGLCTAAPSGRKVTCEYGYTTSATKSTYLHHAAKYHHSEYRMNQFYIGFFIHVLSSLAFTAHEQELFLGLCRHCCFRPSLHILPAPLV